MSQAQSCLAIASLYYSLQLGQCIREGVPLVYRVNHVYTSTIIGSGSSKHPDSSRLQLQVCPLNLKRPYKALGAQSLRMSWGRDRRPRRSRRSWREGSWRRPWRHGHPWRHGEEGLLRGRGGHAGEERRGARGWGHHLLVHRTKGGDTIHIQHPRLVRMQRKRSVGTAVTRRVGKSERTGGTGMDGGTGICIGMCICMGGPPAGGPGGGGGGMPGGGPPAITGTGGMPTGGGGAGGGTGAGAGRFGPAAKNRLGCAPGAGPVPTPRTFRCCARRRSAGVPWRSPVAEAIVRKGCRQCGMKPTTNLPMASFLFLYNSPLASFL